MVCEPVDCLYHNDHFLVYFLRAVDDLLFFYLSRCNVKPVGKELPDILFKKVDTLLQLETFLQFDDDLVERVEVVGVVAAITGKVHDGEDFLFAGIVRLPDTFLPLRQDGLHAATWLGSEHQCLVVVFFKPPVDFMDVFFLSGVGLLGLVMLEDGLAGAVLNESYSM